MKHWVITSIFFAVFTSTFYYSLKEFLFWDKAGDNGNAGMWSIPMSMSGVGLIILIAATIWNVSQ